MNTIFHPMFKKPKQVENEHFSETVIVYELDEGTKKIVNFDLGYYDFEKNVWITFGNDSMILYCWTDISNPEEFMQKKDWPVEYNQGFN